MTAPAAATGAPAARGPALFERGYRPMFLGAALFAGAALPIWLAMLALGLELPSHLAPRDWHVHEMVFGYVGAVLAGFLLTAIPNWTGRLPVAGYPLMTLAVLWLAGRLALSVSAASPLAGIAVDSAFPIALAAIAWREVLAGRNMRNVPICVAVTLFAGANIGFHAAILGGADMRYAERAGLAVIALLICLVGGRIVPSFTRNWMAKRGAKRLPAPFGAVDKAALAATAAASIAWTAAPGSIVTAVLAAVASALLAWRLARWRGWRTAAEPLVLILHLAYLWLPIWLALTAAQAAWPAYVDPSTAMHALTAGAIGTMTIAVMTRATLGHADRPLRAGPLTSAVLVLMLAGASIRVLTPYLPFDALPLLAASGLMWSAAFVLFAAGYAPIFFAKR